MGSFYQVCEFLVRWKPRRIYGRIRSRGTVPVEPHEAVRPLALRTMNRSDTPSLARTYRNDLRCAGSSSLTGPDSPAFPRRRELPCRERQLVRGVFDDLKEPQIAGNLSLSPSPRTGSACAANLPFQGGPDGCSRWPIPSFDRAPSAEPTTAGERILPGASWSTKQAGFCLLNRRRHNAVHYHGTRTSRASYVRQNTS